MNRSFTASDVKTGHESHGHGEKGHSCAWHHTFESPLNDDFEQANDLAEHIGTTGIYESDSAFSSVREWAEIVKALRLHGLEIKAVSR